MSKCDQLEKDREILRILYVDYIRSEIGGGYFVLARLANYFSNHRTFGVIPHILINNAHGFVHRFIDPSIPWYSLNIQKSIAASGRVDSFLNLIKVGAFSFASLFALTIRVIQICRKQRIQLIHANGITSLLIMALPAKIAGVKLVYHFHDALLSSIEGGTIGLPAQRILLFAMRHFADKVIVVSEFVGETVRHVDKVVSYKIRLLHNGLDISSIRQHAIKSYKGGQPLILSYGVLSARKGFQIGIEAVSILKHEFGINVRYQIIGDGSFRNNLIELAQEIKVSEQVEFLDFQDDVHGYVAQADIVLIPSVWEDPLPLVVIESMANSKIIIASQVGGIPEMVLNGESGFLVPKYNARVIAERILDIMKNPESANRMADNAFIRVQKYFTIEHMASELVQIYTECF